MDELRDGGELGQLLLPGLRPDVVCWYVSGPVDPVPGAVFGSVHQHVLHRPEGQVALAVRPPVAGLSPPPAGRARLVAAAQRVLAVCGAAGLVLLDGGDSVSKAHIGY